MTEFLRKNGGSEIPKFPQFVVLSIAVFTKFFFPSKCNPYIFGQRCLALLCFSREIRGTFDSRQNLTDYGLPTISHLYGKFPMANTYEGRHISQSNFDHLAQIRWKNLIDNHILSFLQKRYEIKNLCFCLFVIVLRYRAALPDGSKQNGNSGIRQPSKTPE